MITALKIIGLSLLGGLILLVLIILGIWWFLRRLGRQVADLERVLPCRVTLEPEPNPQWLNASAVQGFIKELRALGFRDIGSFQIPEMEGLLLHALHHPAEPSYAVVYDHRKMAATVDIVRDFTDEFGITAANTGMGSTLDQRPDAKTYWMDKASAAELFQAIKSHRHSAPAKRHAPQDFVASFQDNYTKSMNWRMRKGGVSQEEIRRQAQQSGYTLDDEQFTEAWKAQREQYRRQLQEGCIAQFLDETKPPAAEWERLSHRAFVIAETFERDDIVDVLNTHIILDAEQQHRLERLETKFGESGLDIAQRFIAEAGLNVVRHGEVQQPVHALILLRKNEDGETPEA